jgi:hypothetical protein
MQNTELTPSSADSTSPRPHAAAASTTSLSCQSCRRLKRKCSKEQPTCSLCARVGRNCTYPTSGSSPDKSLASSRKRSWAEAIGLNDSRSSSAYPATVSLGYHRGRWTDDDGNGLPKRPSPRFPTAWFIDSAFARGMDVGVPTDLRWDKIDGTRVTVSVADAEQITDHYFKTTHEWLPVG